MRKINIIEALTGVKVNCPNDAYHEEVVVGRYTIKGIFLLDGDYLFYIFRGDELRAIISRDDWYISRMDGECQNLLNRLMTVYG